MVWNALWTRVQFNQLQKLLPPDKNSIEYADWDRREFLSLIESLDEWNENWRHIESDEQRILRTGRFLQSTTIYSYLYVVRQYEQYQEDQIEPGVSIHHIETSLPKLDYLWMLREHPRRFIEFATAGSYSIVRDWEVLRAFLGNDLVPPTDYRREVWKGSERYVNRSVDGLRLALENHLLDLEPPPSFVRTLVTTLGAWDTLEKRYQDNDSYRTEDQWAPTREEWQNIESACRWAIEYQAERYGVSLDVGDDDVETEQVEEQVNKIQCRECSAEISASTAEEFAGLCAACFEEIWGSVR